MKEEQLHKLGLSLDKYGQIHPPKHERDGSGKCWKVLKVKGDESWILCGRSSYEALIPCDLHLPLNGNIMKHKLHECNYEYCFTCQGGLSSCDICFGAEGSLPSDCPGLRLNPDTLQDIYDNKIDFKNGKWIKLIKQDK